MTVALHAQGLGGVHLVGGDDQDDAPLGADGPAVVGADVLLGQGVDVGPGLVAVHGVGHVAPHLGPVPGVLGRVDEHRDARVARARCARAGAEARC